MSEARKPKIHTLKTWPAQYQAVVAGTKTYEIRDTSDRDFQVGDVLVLQEYDPSSGYTGDMVSKRISYITHGGCWGLPSSLAVLAIQPL